MPHLIVKQRNALSTMGLALLIALAYAVAREALYYKTVCQSGFSLYSSGNQNDPRAFPAFPVLTGRYGKLLAKAMTTKLAWFYPTASHSWIKGVCCFVLVITFPSHSLKRNYLEKVWIKCVIMQTFVHSRAELRYFGKNTNFGPWKSIIRIPLVRLGLWESHWKWYRGTTQCT